MKNIYLFNPYVPEEAITEVNDTLRSKWIGQGPRVDKFEADFSAKFNQKYCVSVNSGSSALETAYELAGIKAGDEVITTPLTCLYGNETVKLPDGKTMPIRKMVKEKYNGKVVSYNETKKD